MKPVYKYKIINSQVMEAKEYETSPQSNAIVFTNKGDTPVYVNGELLNQNDSLSNSGLQGEFDKTVYSINFGTLVTTALLYIREKVYID